jgi:hypothetical protein
MCLRTSSSVDSLYCSVTSTPIKQRHEYAHKNTVRDQSPTTPSVTSHQQTHRQLAVPLQSEEAEDAGPRTPVLTLIQCCSTHKHAMLAHDPQTNSMTNSMNCTRTHTLCYTMIGQHHALHDLAGIGMPHALNHPACHPRALHHPACQLLSARRHTRGIHTKHAHGSHTWHTHACTMTHTCHTHMTHICNTHMRTHGIHARSAPGTCLELCLPSRVPICFSYPASL